MTTTTNDTALWNYDFEETMRMPASQFDALIEMLDAPDAPMHKFTSRSGAVGAPIDQCSQCGSFRDEHV